MRRPLRGLRPRPDRGFGAWPDPRRPDARRRRLAVRRVRRQQGRHRRQLPARCFDHGARASPSASAAPRREDALRRHGGAELLPQALRPGLGAGRRRRLQQGLHHRPGDHRRVPDAELCADALDESFSGARSFDDAMGEYQSTRDEHVLPMYEFTCQLATLEPPPPEMQQLLGAVHGNQEAMDGFARVNAGVTSPAEFFSEENVGRIFAAAHCSVPTRAACAARFDSAALARLPAVAAGAWTRPVSRQSDLSRYRRSAAPIPALGSITEIWTASASQV